MRQDQMFRLRTKCLEMQKQAFSVARSKGLSDAEALECAKIARATAWNDWACDRISELGRLLDRRKSVKLRSRGEDLETWIAHHDDQMQAWLRSSTVDFSELSYAAPFDLEGAAPSPPKCAKAACFDDFIFPSLLDLSNTKFHNSIYFRRAVFLGEAIFDNCIFHGDACFEEANFRRATFERAIFSKPTSFQGSTASSTINFNRAAFGDVTSFKECTHLGHTSFAGASFQKMAWFDAFCTLGRAAFDRARFLDDASFVGARFLGESATFAFASFKKDAHFHGCIFQGATWFDFTQFDAAAWFTDAAFHEECSYRGATFNFMTNFAGSTFFDAVSFCSMRARHNFCLVEAEFRALPDFCESDFHIPPQFNATPFLRLPRRQRGKDSQERYRALKCISAQGQNHKQELEFFASELNAANDAGLWKLIRVMYCYTSDYGLSIGLPISWLAILFSFCSCAYLAMHAFYGANNVACIRGSGHVVPAALHLSLTKSYMFFSAEPTSEKAAATRLSQDYACLYGPNIAEPLSQSGAGPHFAAAQIPWPVEAVAAVQSICTGVLIFLLLVAIRNRFRLR